MTRRLPTPGDFILLWRVGRAAAAVRRALHAADRVDDQHAYPHLADSARALQAALTALKSAGPELDDDWHPEPTAGLQIRRGTTRVSFTPTPGAPNTEPINLLTADGDAWDDISDGSHGWIVHGDGMLPVTVHKSPARGDSSVRFTVGDPLETVSEQPDTGRPGPCTVDLGSARVDHEPGDTLQVADGELGMRWTAREHLTAGERVIGRVDTLDAFRRPAGP